MATITSVGSGLWSAAGTWDAGVPADGDSVVIASGHTVTFDVDHSAWITGLAGIIITGILEFSRIAGTYYLFMSAAAAITGAGVMNVGTSLNPIPFDAKHTITGGNGWYITGTAGLTLGVYAAEPQYKYVRLSNSALNGATTLEVDTDLTGDIWQPGDMILIARSRLHTGYDRVINTITATTITLTVGTGSALDTYSVVALIRRNVRFLEAGGTANGIIRQFSTAGKLTLAGGEFLGSTTLGSGGSLVRDCPYVVISGGTFYKSYYQLHSCSRASISGGVFANVGITYCLTNFTNSTITGGVFLSQYIVFNTTAGTLVSGGLFICNYIVYPNTSGAGVISGGRFESISYVLWGPTYVTITGGVFVNNLNNLYMLSFCTITGGATIDSSNVTVFATAPNCIAYNLNFNGVTQHSAYTSANYRFLTQSLNHEAVDGAYKAWSMGGITISQSTTKPAGYAYAYHMALESADWECFWKKSFTVAAGESVNIEVHLRKDAAMSYLPRVYLVNSIDDPLGGAPPVQSFTMTDSVDTWESDTFAITNNTEFDHDYVLWFVGKNATGNVYSALTITTVPDTSDISLAVWTYANRELTTPADYQADVSALATSAEIAALNDLDAAGIRAAVGLALANIDQQFLDIVSWAAINLDESITAGEIIQIRGNSWTIAIADLSLSANKQQFAIKSTHRNAALNQSAPAWSSSTPDADALLFVDSDTGLLYLNGALAADPTLGSLVYVGTTLTLTLKPAATALLPPGTYTFGIQSVDALGVVSETYGGKFTITADIVRAVS